jgi:anti-anti-sigma factor
MTVPNLAILETQEEGFLRLHLRGELDIASAPLLEDRLSELRASHLAVRLDLSRLEFMDSTGLHALIQAMNDANANGWHLQIDRDVAPQAMRILEITNFERLIPGYDSDQS